MNELIECTMCHFTSNQRTEINRHAVRNHRFDPNFRIQCGLCGVTYDSWYSYVSHQQRKHRNDNHPEQAVEHIPVAQDLQAVLDNEAVVDAYEALDPGEPGPEDLEYMPTEEQLKLNAAKFLLHSRETSTLSQRSLNKIVGGVNDLVEQRDFILKRKLTQELTPDEEGGNIIHNIFESISGDIFRGLNSKYNLDKYVIDKKFIILPTATPIAEICVWKRVTQPIVRSILVRRKVYCQTVSFKESLTQLLNNDGVLRCVDQPRANGVDIIRDFKDGEYFQNHPIFSTNPAALAITLYYDDVEVVNPLGSKVKVHKVGLFYWALTNVYPELRSTLNNINLLAIARTVHIRKYGIRKILEPFLSEIKALEQPQGIELLIHGRPRRFRGSLLFVTGDTLASCYLGGFKEGVGFANRPCRTCLVKKENLRDGFNDADFQRRTLAHHVQCCARIEEPGLTKQAKAFWSTLYGIVGSSPLNELEFFDVTKCLPHDFMHVFAEGVLPMEMLLLIKHCIYQGYFRLEDLNNKISSFNYKHLIGNKPTLIEPSHLECNLRQNAAQLMTLGYLLPFFIGEFLCEDEEHFVNFIRLVKIMNVCLAFEIKKEDIDLLGRMIEIHHLNFVDSYPEASITPKFHYMIHLPEQIRQFGLLRHQWCMRFEAAHNHFKILASVMKNFKNVPFSLAYRHQALRCSQLMAAPGQPSRKFLYAGDQISPGKIINVEDHQYHHIIGPFLNVPYNTQILVSPQVIVHGCTYKAGAVIMTACETDNLPEFAKVMDLIVLRLKTFIFYQKMETVCYSKQVNAYKVLEINQWEMMSINDMIHPHNLSTHEYDGSDYVILLNHSRTEFV